MKHLAQIKEKVHPPKIVYHVASLKGYKRYTEHNMILGVVRAWLNIEDALDFQKRTKRPYLLRINTDGLVWYRLEGHKGVAIITPNNVRNFSAI